MPFITVPILQEALGLGLVYGLVALALYVSYTTLNIADLSTDGCFTLGCAVCCQVAIMGHPFLGLAAGMLAGICSGFITALLQTRFGIQSIVAGIVVNTGLYTINIMAMGNASVLSLTRSDTVFTLFKAQFGDLGGWYKTVVAAIAVLLMSLLVALFMVTRLGLSVRATGDNADMVRASSINPAVTITVGLCVSNAFTGLAGGLLGQYQKSCDINIGSGMVTIALASLIIGQTLLGANRHPGIWRHIVGTAVGSCVYRLAVALALRMNMPAAFLKLISAVIVAIAIAMPALKKRLELQKRMMAEGRKEGR